MGIDLIYLNADDFLNITGVRMGTVVVLGSLIADLVAYAPRLPYPGESLIGDDFNSFLGGKGINQAIVAARLGAKVTLIGRVGTDTFGDGFFPLLEHEGIDDTYVERDPKIGTGVSLVVISKESGQNSIVALPRANLVVPRETVETALAAIPERLKPEEHAIFLTQCETSRISYETGLKRARELGMTTILNAAPIPRDPLDAAIFSLVDILIVNEVEAAALANISVTSSASAQEAVEVLLARGPQDVIVTLGAQGSLWGTYAADGSLSCQIIPAFNVKSVDATAAGDAFCGALATSLADGISMLDALRRASAAGAIAASRQGAIASLPTIEDIAALLAQA
jgi:ribokinase